MDTLTALPSNPTLQVYDGAGAAEDASESGVKQMLWGVKTLSDKIIAP